MNRLCLLMLITLLLPQTGCVAVGNLLRKKQKPSDTKPAAAKPVAVGIVELVNPDARFVIVHLNANSPLPEGTELTCASATGQTAKLKVTPERKNIFITADITSGTPQKGDVVLQGNVPAPEATGPATAPTPASVPTNDPASPAPPTISISPADIAAPLSAPAPPPVSPEEFLRPVPSNR